MSEPPYRQVAALFDELIDLSLVDRQARLSALATLEPELGIRLRKLFGAEAAAGDFLGMFPGDPSGASETVSMEARTDATIGPYRLIRRLGAGGTGVVWLAHDSRLDRAVALKLFRGGDVPTAERMRNEARLAAQLDHPHVAIIHEIGMTTAGEPFIAMAWSDAGSLADRIAVGPVPVDRVLDVMTQAAKALAAAHTAGIVHRDVKPANLLLSDDGWVRLSDFGAAQWVDAANDSAPSVGTLRFMAPEQLRQGSIDHRADLWALGVALYQALTGRLPFDGGSIGSVLFDVTRSEPTPPGRLVALPPALDALVMELLAKDPGERPATALQVATRLEEIRLGMHARERNTRLPMPAAPLIGREAEIDRASELLAERRLVTLTGAGGTGKTRLAIELARCTEGNYLAGCCYVELAALRDGRELPNLIAQDMGISESGEAGVIEQLLRACREVDRLLVLDNCEHLDSVAALVTTLLSGAPRLRILATSRSPLGVPGEQELPVPPLALPVGDEDLTAPAVALLVARIRERDPAFMISEANATALVSICRRLDGLPLAIELAAARVRTLGVAAVAARLDESTTWLQAAHGGRPARHQTLEAAIEWSYALLDEEEQRLFRHLAPFVGGFDLDQAIAVAASIDLQRPADELLGSLIDKSLVMPARPEVGVERCTQLVTIRAYAATRLHDLGEDVAARRTHAMLCLKRATTASALMYGPREAAAHASLQADQANLRDALDWLITTGDLDRAAQLAVALHRHWLLSGRFTREIVARLGKVDRDMSHEAPSTLHADLLKVLGSLSGLAGEHQQVTCHHFTRAQQIYREIGDVHGEALVLNHVGWCSLLLGRYSAAEQYSSAAQALHRRGADPAGVAVSHINLGWVALKRTQLDAAEGHFASALVLREAMEDRRAIAYANGHLGTVAFHRGDPSTAMSYYEHDRMAAIAQLGDRIAGPSFGLRRALAQHALHPEMPVLARVRDILLPQLRESSHGWSLAFALAVLGRLQIDAADPEAAEVLLAEGQRIAEVTGLASSTAGCQALRGEASLRAGRLDAAATQLAASVAVRNRIGEPLGVIKVAELAAEWLVLRGRAEPALALLTGADRARRDLGAARLPRTAEWVAQLENRLVDELTVDRSTEARRVGVTLGWPQLGDMVLAELSR